METVRKIVRSEYFPAAAVLAGVVLFWVVALTGGLSMLNDRNLPITTLTWMLFVYLIAVLTPIAGLMATADLVRRYRWNRRMRREQNERRIGQTTDEPADANRTDGQKAA